MTDYYEKSVELHRRLHGKIGVSLKASVVTKDDLSVVYTPGVGRPCQEIYASPDLAWEMTIKRNSVAVVTDGSSVLGLGNIGPLAALPVMEGKAMLFKAYADIDAWPICLDTQDVEEIIETVRRIAPGFGGINLEDISAPRCFEIETRLQNLGIPVFHDDQNGTAAVVLAALHNGCKALNRSMSELRVVVVGAGAAGVAISKLLLGDDDDSVGSLVKDIIVCDSAGILHKDRKGLNSVKQELVGFTNKDSRTGSLREALVGSDLFIGVSHGNLLQAEDIALMNPNPIIFALANPEPEIMPEDAKRGGAALVATGRSDFPNQVNNVLIFPGIFRGALDARAKQITPKMIRVAAKALAESLENPTVDKILPDPLDRSIAPVIGKAVAVAAQ